MIMKDRDGLFLGLNKQQRLARVLANTTFFVSIDLMPCTGSTGYLLNPCFLQINVGLIPWPVL